MAEKKKKYDLETYSGAVDAYLAKKDSVGSYDDKYGTALKNGYSALKNDKFEYDPAADRNAQTQVKALRTSAERGMKDTMGRATQLTGGYNNSYAQTAAQQVYDQTMSQVDDIYAAAREQARSEWLDERSDKYNQLSVLGEMSDRDYGRWADERSRADAEASDYLAIAESNRDREYQAKRDEVGDAQWRESFDYQKERDSVGDDQWQASFDYQKQRDAVDDERWQTEYDASVASAEYETQKEDEASLYTFTGVNEDGRSVFYKDGKEYVYDYGINPYTGTKNPDAKNGTFNNGYQPDNVGGSKLKKTGKTDVVNGRRQNVWETSDGTEYIWDGSQNMYLEYVEE